MVRPAPPDPVRETLLAVLKQLNQAETVHEGHKEEQGLELAEVQRRLVDFPPVREGSVKVAVALGLLLRNGLIRAPGGPGYSWQRQRASLQRYEITTEGKKFLVEAIESDQRVR